jgi:hypothetical protein
MKKFCSRICLYAASWDKAYKYCVDVAPQMVMGLGYLRVQHQSTPLPFRPHTFQRDR